MEGSASPRKTGAPGPFCKTLTAREVEATDAQTLAQKLRAEQQKANIEINYLEQTHEIKMRLFDAETSTQVTHAIISNASSVS